MDYPKSSLQLNELKRSLKANFNNVHIYSPKKPLGIIITKDYFCGAIILIKPIKTFNMKKIFTLSFGCFLLMMGMAEGQTNVYHPFPDSNAWWGEMNWWTFWVTQSQGCTVTDEHKLYVAGDTLIGINHYQKLFQYGYEWSNTCPSSGTCCYYSNIYKGAIRQDTSVKKVYLFYGSSDTLLYDFNLSVGDTLPISFNNPGNNNIVTSIDSVFIGNNYRKKFHIGSYASIIEGIGCDEGLLDYIGGWFEAGSALHCFHQDNLSYIIRDTIGFGYVTDSTYDCNLDIGIPIITNKESITIYPNPATTTLTLHLQLSIPNSQFIVSDITGREIFHQAINNSIQTTIDVSDWSNGVYIYQLTNNKETFRGKFVKQ